ncbi:MAG: STAS domain-containing protein [Chloroflexi bacterium]|nr:MAG: STAS domain-containing protein [Chloroflexota bacterium]
MDILVEPVGSVTVVALTGDLDGSTAPQAQSEVLALMGPGCKILLDLTRVDFMSSAGARLLLLIYRQITHNSGDILLAGLNTEIEDMLSATGFLDYFKVATTVDEGLERLRG